MERYAAATGAGTGTSIAETTVPKVSTGSPSPVGTESVPGLIGRGIWA